MSDTGERASGAARLEQAARAAWLYYIGGRTQDEISALMHLSRQAVQRLVSLAVEEKLIKFRFDHPIGTSMALGARLTERYGLRSCEVVPADGSDAALAGLAVAGARWLERWFAQKAPLVLGVSTGSTLRATAAELRPMHAPQHKLFSLCGIITADGRAIATEPVMRIAERIGAQCYPMPLPVVAATIEERRLLQSQRAFATLQALMAEAAVLLVGVGHIGWQSPLHAAGCISDGELTELLRAGAVGEIAGHSFDAGGRLLEGAANARATGLTPRPAADQIRVGIGAGAAKVAALRGALVGGLLNGIITDEPTAAAILDTTTAA